MVLKNGQPGIVEIFRRMNICFALTAGILMSCVSDSPKEESIGLVGTYHDLPPFVAGNRMNVDYTCILQSGVYISFHLFSDDTSSIEKINGLRMIAATWSLIGDTLRINNEKIGSLYDQNGLGPDWPQKISMTPIPNSLDLRVDLNEDGFNYYSADGTLMKSIRQRPHDLIKGSCPD